MDTSSQALSEEFQKRLRAFVLRRVQADADADDVVQDVLTKLVLRGPTPPGSVHAWLFTVARHAIIDRGRTRRGHVGLDAIDLAGEPPEGEGATGELARCLGPMMEALSADDRLVLSRIDMGGESQADLARELGVSPSGVKSRVQRARSRLRAALESCCSVACDAGEADRLPKAGRHRLRVLPRGLGLLSRRRLSKRRPPSRRVNGARG